MSRLSLTILATLSVPLLIACESEAPELEEEEAASPATDAFEQPKYEGGDEQETASDAEIARAIDLVASHFNRANQLGASFDDLEGRENPKGEGIFVYSPKTRYGGAERLLVWLVFDGQAYALNGPTKSMITPDLPWPYPRSGTREQWSKTGLLPNPTQAAVDVVFR